MTTLEDRLKEIEAHHAACACGEGCLEAVRFARKEREKRVSIHGRYLCEQDPDYCSVPNDLGDQFEHACQHHMDEARAEIEEE